MKYEERSYPAPYLTEREAQIAALVASGLGNKQIAQELCISDQTVKNHITGILKKYNFKNRQEIVMLFYSVEVERLRAEKAALQARLDLFIRAQELYCICNIPEAN